MDQARKTARLALVLGGGAPNATLMAGAVSAFIDAGIEFDVISTSGAGAIVGLLYQASRQGDARAAMDGLPGMGIADLIYKLFPVNFKVFNKPGAMADAWRALEAQNPVLKLIQQQASQGPAQRLLADWTALMMATLCPSDLSPQSKGLCAHVPFIEQIVDFDKLKTIKPQFYLNAYSLSRREMACWDKDEITHEHFLAALSFPFIYPPYLLDGDYYIEGAAIDTLNLKQLFLDYQHIDCTVVCDVLGAEQLLHPPRDLYDAWVQSIITPLTEIARDDIKLFEAKHNAGDAFTRLLKVDFQKHLDAARQEEELDWSYSNLERLYQVGRQAGAEFCELHGKELKPPRAAKRAQSSEVPG